jgi:two-component system sensor histidine kinase/response regulator
MTTVLAIEDEPAILENILETLEFGAFTALGAKNGLVGVNMARQHLPDLIVSDIMMPEMDGYAVLNELRNDPTTASIPFIFLTAKTERESIRHAMQIGADDYLTKPFTPSELLVAINSRLERHTRIVEEQQQKLKELRGSLIYMLPHELRTPLNSVLGYAEMLISDAADMQADEVADAARYIQKGGLRLLRMIENFLITAQLEIQKDDAEWIAKLRDARTSFPEVDIANLAQAKAEKVGRTTDLEIDVQKVEALRISQDNFKKIIEELVDNAFKFSKPRTPVQISARPDQDAYLIQITDCGRGVTTQQIAAIGVYMQFERWLHEQQGSGLGLNIAQGLINLHGGNLKIESTLTEGTTMSIRLPLAPEDAA